MIPLAAIGVAVLLGVSACSSGTSSSGSGSGSGSGSATPSGSAAATPGSFAGRTAPAASGSIAAVTGTTMQVQNQQSGQVAVTWTRSTTFTQQVSVALSTLKAGDCVTAVDGSATSSGTPSSTSSSTASSATTSFTASTITVRSATNGSCSGAAGRTRPTGAAPSDLPSRANRPTGSGARRAAGSVASGSVVSVSGDQVVVNAREFGANASRTTTKKTITVDASTKITTQRAATASAVKVGLCATAQGKADSSGTVTATSLALTDPVDGRCTGGFGGGFPGGFGG